MAAKIGCTSQTLSNWVRQADHHQDKRPNLRRATDAELDLRSRFVRCRMRRRHNRRDIDDGGRANIGN